MTTLIVSACLLAAQDNTTIIHQPTERMVLNWTSFNIGAGHTVRFDQPSSTSVAINRVTGPDPSIILGNLQANGQVWILNPNGILFGPTARVDVAGLVASTLSMTDTGLVQDPAKAPSFVINQGQINAGTVVLAAPVVWNSGSIRGRSIHLLSGREVRIDPQVQLIEYDHLNLEAVHVVEEAGLVRLEGTTTVAGSLTAQVIQILGEHVIVKEPCEIVGHEILIGGDYRGGSGIRTAKTAFVENGVEIHADGGAHGNGGKVILWSDEGTVFHGTITARGGEQGGDGGFIETSGRDYLQVSGSHIDASAPFGRPGVWLMDPHDLSITTSATTGVTTSGSNPITYTTSADSAVVSQTDVLNPTYS
jgi:filamentous hemagglutinin family protein